MCRIINLDTKNVYFITNYCKLQYSINTQINKIGGDVILQRMTSVDKMTSSHLNLIIFHLEKVCLFSPQTCDVMKRKFGQLLIIAVIFFFGVNERKKFAYLFSKYTNSRVVKVQPIGELLQLVTV